MTEPLHDEKTLRIFRWLESYYPGCSVITADDPFSRVDAMIVSHKPWQLPTWKGVYEVKTRNTMPDQYPDYTIDNRKVLALHHLSHGMQTHGYLVVCFADDSLYRWRIASCGNLLTKGQVFDSVNGPLRSLPNSEREFLGKLPRAA